MGRYKQSHPDLWLVPIALSIGTGVAAIILFIIFLVVRSNAVEITEVVNSTQNSSEWKSGTCHIKKYGTEQLKLTGETPTGYEENCSLTQASGFPSSSVVVSGLTSITIENHENDQIIDLNEDDDEVSLFRRRRSRRRKKRTRRTKRRTKRKYSPRTKSYTKKKTSTKPVYDYFTRTHAIVNVYDSNDSLVSENRHIFVTFEPRHCGFIEERSADFTINNDFMKTAALKPQECIYHDENLQNEVASTTGNVLLSIGTSATVNYFEDSKNGYFTAFTVLLGITLILLTVSFILYLMYHPNAAANWMPRKVASKAETAPITEPAPVNERRSDFPEGFDQNGNPIVEPSAPSYESELNNMFQ